MKIRHRYFILTGVTMLLAANVITSNAADTTAISPIKEGKIIAFDEKKGNCLACHAIEGGSLPGNIGPPLINMRERYPDKKRLRAQIWDASRFNPNTIMPPYGRHEILTDREINQVLEFIYSL